MTFILNYFRSNYQENFSMCFSVCITETEIERQRETERWGERESSEEEKTKNQDLIHPCSTSKKLKLSSNNHHTKVNIKTICRALALLKQDECQL